jgi:hypothetical protein
VNGEATDLSRTRVETYEQVAVGGWESRRQAKLVALAAER